MLTLSVDAMGGDHGPSVVIPVLGHALKLLEGRGVRFLIHGDEAQITAELAKVPALAALATVRHTDKFISMDEKPSQAMRRGKGSSLWNAVESVKAAIPAR